MRKALALAVVCMAVLPGLAQQIGDAVVVIAENKAQLQNGRTVLGNVTKGNLLVVEKAVDGWLLVRWEGLKGYVRKNDVLTIDRALDHFTKAISTYPGPDDYDCRGVIWGAKGEYDKALADFDAALRLDPRLATAHVNRGVTWTLKGAYDKALADFNEAIQIDPDYARAQSHIGWLLASCPEADYRNGRKAIEHATKACELTSLKCPFSLEALAAACAETGDFERAVEWQRIALSRNPNNEKEIRLKLALYESGKPYRLKQGIRTSILDTQR